MNSKVREIVEVKQDVLQTIKLNKLKWHENVCRIGAYQKFSQTTVRQGEGGEAIMDEF